MCEELPDIAERARLFGKQGDKRVIRGQLVIDPIEVADLVDRPHPKPTLEAKCQRANGITSRDRIGCPRLAIERDDVVAAEIEDTIGILRCDPTRLVSNGFARVKQLDNRESRFGAHRRSPECAERGKNEINQLSAGFHFYVRCKN